MTDSPLTAPQHDDGRNDQHDALARELGPVPGGWSVSSCEVLDRAFQLAQPALPDALLDEPDVIEANRRSDYMPYWAWLWPAALPMTRAVLRGNWTAGEDVLELGTGIGIVGMAALARGCRVTLSDYEPRAVRLALYNVRLNGLAGGTGLVLDWCQPPPRTFPTVLGCDLLYERRIHAPLGAFLHAVLGADGTGWLGDPGRACAEQFCRDADALGLELSLFDEHWQPLDGFRVGRFHLIRVRRRGPYAVVPPPPAAAATAG